MTTDLSQCIGSQEGFTDWVLDGPMCPGFILTGWIDCSSGPPFILSMVLRICPETVGKIDPWEDWSDYDCTINGVHGNLCYFSVGNYVEWRIGDNTYLFPGGGYAYRDVAGAVWTKRQSYWGCTNDYGELYFWVDEWDGIRPVYACSGAAETDPSSFSLSPIGVKLERISTGETILDFEIGVSSSGSPTPNDFCEIPESHTGAFTLTVNAGRVSIAKGVDWVTKA